MDRPRPGNSRLPQTSPPRRVGAQDDDPFLAHVARAKAGLPAGFRKYLTDVVIQTPDFADAETLDVMGIDTPWGLLGLYSGIPVGERSHQISGGRPDMIFLYREPIHAYAAQEGETLEAVIRHVLIHEIGHHFGLSDDDMHALEEAAERDERG
jgi:predicted Zn-dependent protease with MMP-like domain